MRSAEERLLNATYVKALTEWAPGTPSPRSGHEEVPSIRLRFIIFISELN